MIESRYVGFSKSMMRKGKKQKASCPIRTSSSNPAAGRNGRAARDPSERMDAILKPETMAGSPDADAPSWPASRNLAHGFLFCGAPLFVNS
jgi:hypothetical protein